MSYILDALRKADAERERGRVPGIHAQQASEPGDTEAPDRSKPLLWLVVGVLAALAAALAWNLLQRDAAPQLAQSAATPHVATAAPLPADAASVTPAAALALHSAASGASTAASAASATAASAAAASATTAAAAAKPVPAHTAKKHSTHKHAATDTAVAGARKGANTSTKTAMNAPSKETANAPAKEAANAPAKEAEKRVYALNELPPEIRQQLPALAVGGASYSVNPSSRMLIINGQVFHEHDRLMPDLLLQQIKLKAAVLEFKGYRYEIKY